MAGIIFLAPLIMGGRTPLGKLVYLILVAVLTVCWLGQQATSDNPSRWKQSGTEWILLGGVVVLTLQLIHWPLLLLHQFSPYQAELLPQWSHSLSSAMGHSAWDRISLTPHETWLAAGVYVGHAMLFLVLVQRFQRLEEIERLLRWLAIGALVMAVLGLLQYASGTEKFAWLFEHESRPANLEVTGPFSNSNHFAHFLALGIGPLIWWLQRFNQVVASGPTGNTFRGQKSNSSWFLAATIAALAVVALAGLLTKSRGGMLVMFLGASTAIFLYVRLKMLSTRAWYAIGGIALLVLLGLAFHGYQGVQKELQTMTTASLDSIDQGGARRKIWQADWEVAKRFPILGTGVGSHIEVYHRFFPHFSNIQYTHAESSLLQILTETGIVGFGLVVMGLMVCMRWAFGGLRAANRDVQIYTVAIAVGLLVSVTHAVFDFPWHIPSCMSLAIAMAAAACCLSQHARADSKASLAEPRGGVSALARTPVYALLGTLGLFVFIHAFVGPAIADQHWTRYRRLSLQSKRDVHSWRTSGESEEERSRKKATSSMEMNRRMATYLQRTIQYNPHHLRAHWRLAEVCLRLFELTQQQSDNVMGLQQIRDAAMASQFSGRQKLDEWLDRAVGEQRLLLDRALYHIQRTARLCPLQGKVYLYESNLVFLRGIGLDGAQELIAAAARVRPHDAAVLFSIGREEFLANNVEAAMTSWIQSFRVSDEYRDDIISIVAGQMAAPQFISFFEPDVDGLESLLRFYRKQEMINQARIVGPLVIQHLTESAEKKSGVASAVLWHRSRGIYRYLGDQDQALACARRAVAVAPNWLKGRISLADELLAQGQLQDSLEEYKWCARRRPHDPKTSQQIKNIESLIVRQQAANDRFANAVPPDDPADTRY